MKPVGRALLSFAPTWLVVLSVVAAEAAVFTTQAPPLGHAIVYGAVGALALAAWPFRLAASGTLTKLRLPTTADALGEAEQLRRELEGLEDGRPIKQLDAFLDKRNTLASVLRKRLEAGELTYARYLTTAEQVFEAALHNLHEIAVAEMSISAIDDEDLDLFRYAETVEEAWNMIRQFHHH